MNLMAENSTKKSRRWGDNLFWSFILTNAFLASIIMLLIVAFLLFESWGFLNRIGVEHFFTDEEWFPLDELFNLSPMLAGSLGVTFGALILAAPFSIIFATFCVFYTKGTTRLVLERFVDVNAAIPTVIYGFWGLMVVVPIINQFSPPGVSLLAGIFVLAMMIFPTITVLTLSALKSVPFASIQGAMALGVRRSSVILNIAIPQAKAGIIMSMILGMTRAIGETMVVLMVCGNVVQVPGSLFDSVRTLTANIALEMPYAMGDHRSSLYVTGLLVLVVVIVLVLFSELYARKHKQAAV